ncbi:AIPR family protein [Microbispora bryophytorum]|uniref:AIPR family protein n=1 Tax=Microbispora bryophytorum TaxID=1460882 RepID=UPI0033C4D48E
MNTTEEARTQLAAGLRELRAAAGQPSTRELAAKIGTVSHTTVADVFSGRRLPTWPALAEIVQALNGEQARYRRLWEAAARGVARPTDREREEEAFLDRYRRFAVDHYGQLQPPNFQRRYQVPIDSLYVPPKLRYKDSNRSLELTLQEFERRIDRTVVLGAPGSGKTALLQFLSYQYAKTSDRIPLLLRLHLFAAFSSPFSMVRAIEQQLEAWLQGQPPDGFVERLLADRLSLVTFDGLDEIPTTAARVDMASSIESFAAKYPNARVVVTSRNAEYEKIGLNPHAFSSFEMAEFDDEQADRYIEKWFERKPPHLATAFKSESKNVSDLRRNPLMLAMTCHLYEGIGDIVKKRSDLYQAYWETWVQRWDDLRGIERAAHLEKGYASILGAVALVMLRNGVSRISARDFHRFAADAFNDRLHHRNAAEEAARELAEVLNTQLVVTSEGDGSGRTYSFTHRTLMEYTAALHIIDDCRDPEDAAKRLLGLMRGSEWESIGRLVVQEANKRWTQGASRLIDKLLDLAAARGKQMSGKVKAFLENNPEISELEGDVGRRVSEPLLLAPAVATDRHSDEDCAGSERLSPAVQPCTAIDLRRQQGAQAVREAGISAERESDSKTRIMVEQVRAALLRNYSSLIYEKDLRGFDQSIRDQHFLSRALAADAVRIITGCGHDAAGRAVIDGYEDQGIDAIAVGDTSPEVWLVKAKWSDSGAAKLSEDEALAFAHGVRLIDDRDFEAFNDRIKPLLPRLDAAIGDARLRINLVVALMGPPNLSESVANVLEQLLEEANNYAPLLRYKVLSFADIYQRLREDVAPDPVNVTVTLQSWLRRDIPFEAWQGIVAVGDVAKWHADYGDALYEQNIRRSLGVTRINADIKESLLKEPEYFWYLNNGITLLCDHIEPHYLGRRRGDEPVRLTLNGVSIVNGAQTVTMIREAMESNPEVAEDADVAVRIISPGTERGVYATRISKTTNMQNDVSPRDFIALDPVQAEIREDLLVSEGKIYTYKRGEPDPAPEAGCSIEEAAVALACAHHNPRLAVRVSKHIDSLWERGTRGAYSRLFGEVPSTYRIWRSVQLRRAVGATLALERQGLPGRSADIARRGELLITHLVFQLVDQRGMDDPNLDWQSILDKVPKLTSQVLLLLIFHLDAEFGQKSFLSSIFNEETRCKKLADLILEDARRDASTPGLLENYQSPALRLRKTRRPNAVSTLVSAGLLSDGTPLIYRPQSDSEKAAVASWLAEDPLRAKATWVNDRAQCLLWAYDEEQYSAAGLVLRIWDLAGYADAPVAVQGPDRWILENGLSLRDLAVQLLEGD